MLSNRKFHSQLYLSRKSFPTNNLRYVDIIHCYESNTWFIILYLLLEFLNHFLYPNSGETDDLNITLLPSGWLHIDTANKYAESLGLSFGKISTQDPNRKLISLNLKDMLNDKNLKKLQTAFKQRLLFTTPLYVTWYPNKNNVCPSTIAKYFHMLGCDVIQKLPEINITRDQPFNQKLPTARTSNLSENQEARSVSVYDIENIFAASVLQLQRYDFDVI